MTMTWGSATVLLAGFAAVFLAPAPALSKPITASSNDRQTDLASLKNSNAGSEVDRETISAGGIYYDAAVRVLCLHGGGGSAAGFSQQPGLQQLRAALPNADFVFAQGAYGGSSADPSYLWIRDPPGGKNERTSDPSWADASVAAVDEIVRTRGPFQVLLGYSQGAAFAPFYLSQSKYAPQFARAALFNGYLPSTHAGLMASIAREPLATPAMVFVGEQDVGFRYGGDGLAESFATATQIRSATAGHHLPFASDETFDRVVAFVAGAEIERDAGVTVGSASAGLEAGVGGATVSGSNRAEKSGKKADETVNAPAEQYSKASKSSEQESVRKTESLGNEGERKVGAGQAKGHEDGQTTGKYGTKEDWSTKGYQKKKGAYQMSGQKQDKDDAGTVGEAEVAPSSSTDNNDSDEASTNGARAVSAGFAVAIAIGSLVFC